MAIEDQVYMMRCFELALHGAGWVHPNPMVGCVIVRNGLVVGEGYHGRFGGAHAEIMALKKAGKKAKGATLYVNLEPCAHHGKTPPCVDAILKAGIRQVVSAAEDPNPVVSGRGFRKLRRGGVIVSRGTLRAEARELNERFFTYMETGIPFVALKVAQTLDGRIADQRGASKWITDPAARAYGHGLRSVYDAVLVGAGTVRSDNPLLTVRAIKGRNPIRVVLDGGFSVPTDARLFRNSGAQTVVLTSSVALKRKRKKAVALERRGVAVIGIEGRSTLAPSSVLRVLGDFVNSSVLIEGGAKTIRPFLESGSVNKIHCFIAPKILGDGVTGLNIRSKGVKGARILNDVKITAVGPDLLLEGTLK